MKSKKVHILFALWGMSATLVMAQDKKKADSLNHVLDEVTVTGNRPVVTDSSEYVSKMRLSRMENAQVYTGITNTLMVQQKVYSVEDAILNVPGITIISNGGSNTIDYGGTSFSSRGFSTTVGVYNGMALKMFSNPDVANLEKIEVIKGPSATLFGNIVSSYGGLINRVTKKPYDVLGGSVDMAGGGNGFYRMALDLNMPVNADKTFLARLNTAYDIQHNAQDNDGYSRNFFVAPAFTYKLSDRVKINLNTEFDVSKNAGYNMPLYFAYTPSVIKGALSSALASFQLPAETIAQIVAAAPSTIEATLGTNNIKDLNLDAGLNYGSNDLTAATQSMTISPELHIKLSDQWTSVTTALFSSGNSNGYNVRVNPVPNMIPTFLAGFIASGKIDFGPAGVDYMERSARKYVSSLQSQDLQQNFVGDFSVGRLRNRMVVGLDYFNRRTISTYYNFKGSLFGLPQDQTFDILSLARNPDGSHVDNPGYYQFNASAIDARMIASPGPIQQFDGNQSVYSSYVNDVLNITDQLIASAGLRMDRFVNHGVYDATIDTVRGAFKQTALSPKFGLIYQVIKDRISLFGNYQTSFVNQDGSSITGETFHPEKAFQWEGGVKTSFFDDHFTTTLSYYDIRVNDKIRPDINNYGFQIQDGTQLSRGFEAEILGNPFPELNILFGYAYNNSKMVKSEPLFEGLRPIDAGPEHQVNFWVHYHFNELTPVNGLSVGFGGNYAGETLAVNYNPDGKLIIPAYTVLNAKLSYDRDKYSFGLRVNNLGDERFWRGNSVIIPQMPRQFIGTLAIKI